MRWKPASTAFLLAVLACATTEPVLAAGHGEPRFSQYPARPSAAFGASNYGPGRGRVHSSAVWIPGHEEQVTRRVWVPGRTRREWVPARVETRFDWCGRPFTVCVRPGHWQTVCDPGHYETFVETIWVPGHWQTSPC